MATQRDHGGGLAAAAQKWGGAPADWLDLSTGINPIPYEFGPIPPRIWSRLPDRDAFAAAEAAARRAYKVPPDLEIVAAPGAQALIQIIPRLRRAGRCIVRIPTYNEHAAAFSAEGWQVTQKNWQDDSDLPSSLAPPADAHIFVSPNNPTGDHASTDLLEGLIETKPLLILDQSFADTDPQDVVIPDHILLRAVTLRSLGKFFGLAGVRLGFAIAPPADAAKLRALLGPWAVSGPALEIGRQALLDAGWIAATRQRLAHDSQRLRILLEAHGLRYIGGTALFQTMHHNDAPAIADHLARAHILVRQFPYAPEWLRFGLPGEQADWTRLRSALEKL